MHGEHESQKTLYGLSPSFVPQPIAWGSYKNEPEKYFFLCDFINMTGEIPGPAKFCKKLAELHLKSMENPPKDGFGFHMNTSQGNIPLNNTWNKSWEAFFTQSIVHMIDAEAKTQGPSNEIAELKEPLLKKVIPRLLRPLENKIKPCLVHGDLWHGNTSVVVDTMEPLAFDSCVLWAHNECKWPFNVHTIWGLQFSDEMGIWRAARYKFGRSYIKEYHRYIPVSEPEDEWDDRNTLYGMWVEIPHKVVLLRLTNLVESIFSAPLCMGLTPDSENCRSFNSSYFQNSYLSETQSHCRHEAHGWEIPWRYWRLPRASNINLRPFWELHMGNTAVRVFSCFHWFLPVRIRWILFEAH